MSPTDPVWTPPLREGVGASRVAVGRPATTLDFLKARFPAISDWPSRIERGAVLNAQGEPTTADARLRSGDVLWYWRDPPPEPRVPFDIELLHQDEHLVVVDKPHFLATAPGGRHLRETALVRLRRQLGIDTLSPMHRLDRDTAGVLVFIVKPAERNAYQALLRDRKVRKVYEAIAPSRRDLMMPFRCRNRLEPSPDNAFMQMRVVDGEVNAETLIERIGLFDAAPSPSNHSCHGETHELASYRLTPHTGKTHQLRIHMSTLGMPIVGDRIYPILIPDSAPELALDTEPDYSQPLQLLARELTFIDPVSGQQRCFASRRRLQQQLTAKTI